MIFLKVACAIRDAELAAAVQCCLRGLPVRIVFDQKDLHTFTRQLRGERPDVALIEVGEAGEPGDWVGRVKSGAEGPMVIVVDKTANPAAILAAFRAGADDSSTRRSKITCGVRSSANPTGCGGAPRPKS